MSSHQSALQVAFDVRSAGFHPDVPWGSQLVMLAACLVILRYGDRFRRFLASLVGVFLIASTVSWVGLQHKDYVTLRDVVNSGRYEVVEGIVEDFVPGAATATAASASESALTRTRTPTPK